MGAQLFSHVWLFVAPWAIAHQAPLSMGFTRQEHWSGLPLHTPGDLPDPGIEPMYLASPAVARGFFTPSATWKIVFHLVLRPPPVHRHLQMSSNGTSVRILPSAEISHLLQTTKCGWTKIQKTGINGKIALVLRAEDVVRHYWRRLHWFCF